MRDHRESGTHPTRSRDVFHVLAPDYYKLPEKFLVEQSVENGIARLRETILKRGNEYGGILFKNDKNQLFFEEAGKPGEQLFQINFLVLDSESIDSIERGVFTFFDNKENPPNIVFVSKQDAEAHTSLFLKIVNDGVKVRIDATPVAMFHTHPTGNLPSPGDYAHVVFNPGKLRGGRQLKECVVTANETFFLVPSQQTPDMFKTSFSANPYDYSQELEAKITGIMENLRTHTSDDTALLNAARYKLLQKHCVEDNVGFYVLQKGKQLTTRIV